MGWETRSGNRYYYRKRWVNGRPVSEYVGAGMSLSLIHISEPTRPY